MNDRVEKIRELLNELETEMAAGDTPTSDRYFSAMELPIIIQEIVDDLQPLLTPYEAAYYWYAFRHSIAKGGKPYVRLSRRGLGRGCVKSASSKSTENPVSPSKVAEIFRALEAIGALRMEGEPNRDGTLYRVFTPDEIEACREFRASRVPPEPRSVVADEEIDHYNIRENRLKVYERDGYKCRYCGKQLTRFTATLDHITPIAGGGDNSFGNLITSCLGCNSTKSKRSVGDFLIDG